MRRLLLSLSVIALVVGVVATPSASAQQSLNLYVGGFSPRALDGRGTHDVTFQNLDFSTFDPNDFNGATVGAEWLVGLSDMFDAGIGVGFYQRTSPAVFTDFVNPDQSDIEFDQKLRIVPITATFRYLPLGHRAPFRPYIGAGVGILSWRYTESGAFVDFSNNNNIFRDTFTASGTKAAPVVLGGVTFPIGNVGIGGEIRYQGGKADLPAPDWPAGTTVNLGGMNYLFMVNVRF
jgi:outer membrane protein W